MTLPNRHIAVSGTYSTGKTTTAEALSIATGIPRTGAQTARELVVALLPHKRFEELSAAELWMLGLRRFEERVQAEAEQRGPSISDGSVLNEWIYAEVRMRIGINPGAPVLHRAVKRVMGIPVKPVLQEVFDAFGTVARDRARRAYDVFIHLPVEFEMHTDGHRPVSEEYRRLSDRLLVQTVDELGIPSHVVRGSTVDRVAQIIELLALPVEVPIDEAVARATDRIARSREMTAERQIASVAPKSLRSRARAAVNY